MMSTKPSTFQRKASSSNGGSTSSNKKRARTLAVVWLAVTLVLAQLVTFNGYTWIQEGQEELAPHSQDNNDKDQVSTASSSNIAQQDEEQLYDQRQLLMTDSNNNDNNNGQLVCSNETAPIHCCASWDVPSDDWWLHKPDWQVSLENDTHYCFSPIQNQEEADFIRALHKLQWNESKCHDVEKSVEVNSGFGASIGWLLSSFWYAHIHKKPFQIAQTSRRWLYSTADNTSWAYCDSQDSRCYYLPISPCSRNETIRGMHPSARPNRGKVSEAKQYYWLRKYITRPNQQFRRKQWELRQTFPMQYPCTTMHVRRSDAGLPRPPFRRYAAVQEYLDLANLTTTTITTTSTSAANKKGRTNILLLTDDQTTIDEIQNYHSGYHWMYFDRPRNHGPTGGFESHIPSSDEAFELLVIETEQYLASTCQTVVNGHSSFMKTILDTMHFEGKNFTHYYLKTEISKEEAKKFGRDTSARFYDMMKKIEADTSASKGDQPQNPLTCRDNSISGREECCAPWFIDADDWWTHKPDWEVSLENQTHFCFSPMTDPEKVDFVRQVHERQWVTGNCSEVEMSGEINSGFGAGTSWLLYTFWYAHVKNRPFQIAKSDWHWMYAPKDNTSWAWCDEEDITCYTLPVSKCSRDVPFERNNRNFYKPKPNEKKVAYWLREYMLRPKQLFRRKAYELRTKVNMQYPCTMIHVRRSDAGFPRPPYRRYAALSEYLSAGSVQQGENILLLTDDDSTIDEVNNYHLEDYNWTYLKRLRNRGVKNGWEGHIPSGSDGASEMLTIDTELRLAETCEKIVYGYSGFMKAFFEKMDALGKNYKRYYLDTTVDKEEAKELGKRPVERAASLLEDIQLEYVDPNDGPIVCTEDYRSCCGSWNSSADEWWIHHPDWEVSYENETSFCFAPIQNQEKARFLKDIHELQWFSAKSCSKIQLADEINSGYSGSTSWLLDHFWGAHKQLEPFEIAPSSEPWIYTAKNKSSSFYCETEDTRCYYLPISQCQQNTTGKRATLKRPRGPKGVLQHMWLRDYLFRPVQRLRQRAFELRQTLNVKQPCVAMHIRPDDSIETLIEKNDIPNNGTSVVLIQDDTLSTEPVKTIFPDYNWIYLEPSAGEGGEFDGAFELARIHAELTASSMCDKLVSKSGSKVRGELHIMDSTGRGYTGKPRRRILSAPNKPSEKPRRKRERSDKVLQEANISSSSPLDDSLFCSISTKGTECCGTWEVDSDEWILHKPDWEVSMENQTHYCFAPMKNKDKADFFRKVHEVQWVSGNCSEAIASRQISSGFGASTTFLSYAFLKAHQDDKPFTIMEPEKPWLYGPTDNSSWAFCPRRDITCYYLPVSKCPRPNVRPERHWAHPDRKNERKKLEFEWLQEYMMRPKQIMRQKLLEMRLSFDLKLPCTTMHVRRGDAGFPKQPYRRYAAVQEYLDAAEVEEGSNIMLLTDDQSTIDEINKYHYPGYNWMYLDRPRNQGVDGGWEGHIPSGDGAFDILAIHAEISLASQCSKVVHGDSGFMKVLRGKMEMEGRNHEAYVINTKVSKAEANKWPSDGKERLEHFEKQMAEYRQKSDAEKKTERQKGNGHEHTDDAEQVEVGLSKE